MLFIILPILLFITVLVFIRDDLGPPVPGLVTDPAEGRGAGGPRLRHPQSSLTWTGGCGNVERARGSRAEQQRDPETEKREKEEGEGTWN